jgi:hypothetical protein
MNFRMAFWGSLEESSLNIISMQPTADVFLIVAHA